MSRKEILSEGELDALMESVSSGDVPVQDDHSGTECRSFDFTGREQSLLAQMPALRIINDKHALGMAQGVRDLFRVPAEVEAKDVSLIKLGEVLMSIAEPSAVNTVKTLPLNGVSFVINPGDLTSYFVDQYFGGSSNAPRKRPPGDDLTPTEKHLNEVLVNRFLLTMREAWSETVPLGTELLGTETKPDFLQLGSEEQLVVKSSFEIRVPEWQSSIDWIVPYATLEPLRPKLGSPDTDVHPGRGGADWEQHLRRELPCIELEMSAVFTSDLVSIAQVLGLRKGSVVPLRRPSEVAVCVEGVPFCRGEHGALNGKKSVKITQMLHADADIE